MRTAVAFGFAVPFAVLVALGAGTPACGAPPPPCDRTLSTCERLPWVEQILSARDRKAIPDLRAVAAEDAHERVRERSLGALVTLGDTGAPSLFTDRLSSDTSPAVRRAAAEGIGLLNIRVSQAILAGPLRKDSNPLVRAECARAIGRTARAEAATAVVVSLLEDPSAEVRALSAEAIANLKTEWGTEVLKQAAQDKSPIVRLYVIRGLADSAPNAAVPLFLEVWETTTDPEARIEAFRGLLQSGNSNKWSESGLLDRDERIRFLSLRKWIHENPGKPRGGKWQDDPLASRIEPFLSDSSRGIRELAKGYLESLGFGVRPSGFHYVIRN